MDGGERDLKRNAFDSIHPIVEIAFFAFTLAMPMLFLHPVMLGISFATSLIWFLMIKGRKSISFLLKFVLPVMVAAAVLNPAFNHRGMTILFYLRYNPITLESVFYGAASAAMFGTVLLWFACFNAIMTSDKIIYLFGRIIPSLSLIISMVFRFVPLFKEQTARIALARRCMGEDVRKGDLMKRVKNGLAILSALISWALENSIITADSMRARGFGLRGRTNFSRYRFDGRDVMIGILLALGMGFVSFGVTSNTISIRYFPRFVMNKFSPLAIACCAVYALTLMIPIIINLKEAAVWRCLKSKI